MHGLHSRNWKGPQHRMERHYRNGDIPVRTDYGLAATEFNDYETGLGRKKVLRQVPGCTRMK